MLKGTLNFQALLWTKPLSVRCQKTAKIGPTLLPETQNEKDMLALRTVRACTVLEYGFRVAVRSCQCSNWLRSDFSGPGAQNPRASNAGFQRKARAVADSTALTTIDEDLCGNFMAAVRALRFKRSEAFMSK